MKALGAEIMDFYASYWPDGWYSDDDLFETDGERLLNINPTQKYELDDFGDLYWQGYGNSGKEDDVWEFNDAFKEWKDSLKYITFVVKVPKKFSQELEQYLNEKSWKYTK